MEKRRCKTIHFRRHW